MIWWGHGSSVQLSCTQSAPYSYYKLSQDLWITCQWLCVLVSESNTCLGNALNSTNVSEHMHTQLPNQGPGLDCLIPWLQKNPSGLLGVADCFVFYVRDLKVVISTWLSSRLCFLAWCHSSGLSPPRLLLLALSWRIYYKPQSSKTYILLHCYFLSSYPFSTLASFLQDPIEIAEVNSCYALHYFAGLFYWFTFYLSGRCEFCLPNLILSWEKGRVFHILQCPV